MERLDGSEDCGDSDSTAARLVFTSYHNTIKCKFSRRAKALDGICSGRRFLSARQGVMLWCRYIFFSMLKNAATIIRRKTVLNIQPEVLLTESDTGGSSGNFFHALYSRSTNPSREPCLSGDGQFENCTSLPSPTNCDVFGNTQWKRQQLFPAREPHLFHCGPEAAGSAESRLRPRSLLYQPIS